MVFETRDTTFGVKHKSLKIKFKLKWYDYILNVLNHMNDKKYFSLENFSTTLF